VFFFLSLRAAHDVLIQLESTPMMLQVGQVTGGATKTNPLPSGITFRSFENENVQQLTTLCE